MRTNTMKEALRGGGRVICVQPHFPSPELVEFLGYAGFDGIFVDAEHGTVGVERAQEMVRAADVANIATLVRVPTNAPPVILGYLESGAGGVLVPHVTTAEQARAAVEAVKFAPQGNRGAHWGTRAANYGLTQSAPEYFEQSNRETLTAIMIEDAEALANLEDILQVPGLDLCVIGSGDLSMTLGHPGQPDHPEVQRQVGRALRVIRAAGVPAGTTTGDGPGARRLFEQGFQFVVVSAARLLAASAGQFLAQARGEE
jgi:4-hydroxy-2-oxoheptanedioate aldolase